MAKIHPSACIDGDVTLADDVVVGPGCVITGRPGPVRIGAGTVLRAQVHIEGPCTIGERNTFYPCTSAGFPPQDVSFDPALPGPGLAGDRFRLGTGALLLRDDQPAPAVIHWSP